MIRPLSALTVCGILLGCSGTTSTGAPPPPPRQGLPTAPPTVSAETPAPEKKECSCRLKLKPSPASAEQPKPISGDLPKGPFDLERRSACTTPVCKLDGFVPDAAFLQTTHEGKPAQGAVWLETIADGSAVELPSADEIDAVALVLEGSAEFGAGEAKKTAKSEPLGTWQALKVPGSGYFIRARGGRTSVLMGVTARTGTLADAVKVAQQKKKPASTSRAFEVGDLNTKTKLTWGGGAYHARIAFGTEDTNASLTLIQAGANGTIAENSHDKEWEHIAILRGSGDMLLGNSKYPVRDGAMFQVPPGVVHGFQGGGQELAAVLVFSPSGPEGRFFQLGSGK
ncbi:MAG TPA: cupin domain-containing protein [Polyangiaceae bacterium]|nr:cupin domain-containing protein [Polyangiaceae bacterium]